MFYIMYGQYGDFVKAFDTEEEALAYIESKSCPDDYWVCTDDEEPDDIDSDFGFDAYAGCYTYDCQV